MKKTLLLLMVFALAGNFVSSQTVIYDNGPLINLPGGGFGGADVSHLHDGMNSLGSNHSFASGYRVADDIVVPPGEFWSIDSLVFYSYQTQATNNTISTMLDINIRIWDGVPEAPGSTIVFGDETTNRMVTSEWSGIYRTADFGSANCPPATCTQRAIMRNATTISTVLLPGTYWIDWQSNGSLTSGPWAPQINLGTGVTTSGNALQFVLATLVWQPLVDTVPANAGNPPYEPQGLPFLVVGSVITGLSDLNNNAGIFFYPNPFSYNTTVMLNAQLLKHAIYTFNLFDMYGNMVSNIQNITTNKFEFNRGSLSGGIYVYELKSDTGHLIKDKLVIQ